MMPGVLALLALALMGTSIGAQQDMKKVGLGATVWTLLLGMVVSNGVARVASIEFLQPAAKLAEFYIKVGLVLLAVELSSLAQVDAAQCS